MSSVNLKRKRGDRGYSHACQWYFKLPVTVSVTGTAVIVVVTRRSPDRGERVRSP